MRILRNAAFIGAILMAITMLAVEEIGSSEAVVVMLWFGTVFGLLTFVATQIAILVRDFNNWRRNHRILRRMTS